MAKTNKLLWLPIFTLLLFVSAANASDANVLKTGELSINFWHGHYSRHTFSVSERGYATLTVKKMTPDKSISRGFLFLNRRAISLKKFLRSDSNVFQKKIKVNKDNRLNVFLLGSPGASIKIDIQLHSTPSLPPTVAFEAVPTTITLGEASVLTWQTQNADHVTIDNDILTVEANGTTEVIPVDTTTYTLTATGPGGTTSAQVTVTVNPLPPTVVLTADPDTIVGGHSAVLSWNSDFAQSCVIEPDIGVVDLTGSMTVTPLQTTTYKIIATGEGGEVTDEVKITVTDPPPTVEMASADATIILGEATSLSWTSTNAHTVTIEPDIGSVDPNGSTEISPVETTTYTITATGTGGTQTDQVTVAVQYPLPTITFSASPSTILLGQSSTLNWSATNAESIEIDHDIGTVEASGTHTVSPISTTTYSITAIGPGGTATAEVTLSVTYPQPTVALQVEPDTITLGETSTLSWQSGNTVNVTIDNGIGTVVANGSLPISPTATTTYTITAGGIGGDMVTAAATITVNVPVPAVSLLADPESIVSGGTATLHWTTNYADTVTIEPGLGMVADSGTQAVSPTQTTVYTLTATGPGGTTAESVTVEVLDPPTVSISVDPSTIIGGSEATLMWSTTFADTITIEPDIGTVAADGSLQIAPEATTTYTLTAIGPGGTTSANTTLTVNHPPYVELTALPNTITAGDAATLSWNTRHADTVTIAPGLGEVAASGVMAVTPIQDTMYTITATGPGGTTTAEEKISMIVPKPGITFTATPEQIVSGGTIVLSWDVSHADACVLEPGVGSVDTTSTLEVTPTQNTSYTLMATGPGGRTEASIDVIVHDLGGGPTVSFDQVDVTISQGETAMLSWKSIGADTAHIDNGVGTVTPNGSTTVSPQHTTIYTLTATGISGSGSTQVTVHVIGNPEMQPDGSFGSIYNDLIPSDATVESYDESRFAIITGLVKDKDGKNLEDVTISILGHPEYGSAETDGGGRFAIPVEGGAHMVAVYHKAGLITIQRQVEVPWNDVAVIETVHMIEEDAAATTITFDGNPATVVAHRSTPVTDEAGTRSTTLVFAGDNMAYAVDENGNDMHALGTITTRATEYATPETMPAKLPPNSAFTYCAELKVDGVERVRFEKPVAMWVDNFLGFPVGEVVPVGYYDRDRGVWVPSENGVVVQLLDTDSDGTVDALDADGDGAADDLDDNGSFANEVEGLTDGQQYPVGATYWRAEVPHFSPWDCNWPFGPPPGANWPDPTLASDYSVEDCRQWPNPEVSVRARILSKEIPIPGTDMALHYATNRTNGYRVIFEIEASHDEVPESLKEIEVKLRVAGKEITEKLPPETHQRITLEWDTSNFRGHMMVSNNATSSRSSNVDRSSERPTAHVSVGFVYQGTYQSAAPEQFAFGRTGTDTITGSRTRQTITLEKSTFFDVLTAVRHQKDIAQGWNLNIQHLPIRSNRPKLIKGDGGLLERFSSNYAVTYLMEDGVITTVAGGNGYGFAGDGGLATDAQLRTPKAMVFEAGGEMIVLDQYTGNVRKIDTNGIITTIVGSETSSNYGFSGDGGPATLAEFRSPNDIAIDANGNLYIADTENNRIRKVDLDGIINTIAGSGTPPTVPPGEEGGYGGEDGNADGDGGADEQEDTEDEEEDSGLGDGGPAVDATLNGPAAVAVDPYGNIYIADCYNYRIRMIDPGGNISTIAGTGVYGYTTDGLPAVNSQIFRPVDIFVDQQQIVYILTIEIGEMYHALIQKIDNQGIIRTIYESYDAVSGFTVGSDGDLYLAVEGSNQVVKVEPNEQNTWDAKITVIAGNGDGWSGTYKDGLPATKVALSRPTNLAFGPQGLLYITREEQVHRVSESVPVTYHKSLKETVYTDADGYGYVVSDDLLHLRTIDLHTGRDIYIFGYDNEKNLVTVTDRFGQQTQIQRGPDGTPFAIVAPNELRCELTVNEQNHLTQILLPGDDTYAFEYTDEGLLQKITDPSDSVTEYIFDEWGRIQKVKDPFGSEWLYEKSGVIGEQLVTRIISPDGNRTTYRDENINGHLQSSAVTDANGARIVYERVDSGTAGEPTIRKTLQCDTELTFTYGFDETYNFEYLKKIEEQTPSLLSRTFEFEAGYDDSSGDGVADIITHRAIVNGHAPASVAHDILASVRTATSPEQREAVATYNPNTFLVENITVPGFHDTFFGYDDAGHLTSIQSNTRQRTFEYNAQGFLASVTQMPNRTTMFTHDDIGRITSMTPPGGSTLSFGYDADGHMTVLTHPMGEHRLSYSGYGGRAESYTTPASGGYSYTYDKDRSLARIEFPSGKQIYSDYEQGVLQRIHTPEGNIDFSYASACDNKIDAITKGGEVIYYSFDGPMLTEETVTGTVNQTIGYEYNQDFNITGFTYAGETQILGYDLDGLLTNAGAYTIARNLDNGLPENISGGGLTISRSFNRFGEIETQIVNINGQPVSSWTLTWEDSGQIGQKTETIGGVVRSYVYGYDDMGRLETVTRDGNLVAEYAYDANGVRTMESSALRSITDRSLSFSPEHQLMTAGDISFTYDADGFLESHTNGGDITTYVYSSRGELLNATLPDARVISYQHDPMGRRISKRIDGVTIEKYLWQGALKLLAVYDANDNLLDRFEYADDRMPVSMTRQGSTYFMAYDPNGSLRLVTDASGNVIKRVEYDPFGFIIEDSNPTFVMPFGFGGGLYDPETGLIRIGRRDYDPDIGRWTSKDPDLFSGGDSDLYGYVKNDPVNFFHNGNQGSSVWGGYGAVWAHGASGLPLETMLPKSDPAQSVLFGPIVIGQPSGRAFAGAVEGGIFAEINRQNKKIMADSSPCRGIGWTHLSEYLFKGLFGGFYSGVNSPAGTILPNSTRNVNQIIVQPGESIQSAIELALDGDEVILADGIHTLADGVDYIDFDGRDIILRSENGPANCVIDLQNTKSGFKFYQAETEASKLVGFTITNGEGEFGGAVMIYQASPTIEDCIFVQNQGEKGGAIFIADGSPLLINCTVIKNQAVSGGGIYVQNGAPRIINCTVADNQSTTGSGGGLYSFTDDGMHNIQVISSIIWGNTSQEGNAQIGYSDENLVQLPQVSYSDVQDGFAGMGNINLDPMFADTQADNYHLQAESPCIDAGSSEGALDHDIDGDARPNGWYDMGSDESGVTNGTIFIQQLIDNAYDGDVVLVPAGTYGVGNRNLNFRGKAITLRSAGGPGGVVIDVGGIGRGVVFTNAEGRDSVLDGFTIINGSADKGGGIYIDGASPTLINCTIVKNQATTEGGGIYIQNGAPKIINCTVADNTIPEGGSGGGLYDFAEDGEHLTEVINSIFWNNRSGSDFQQIGYNRKNLYSFQTVITEPPAVSYSDIQGGFAGIGNIDSDPGFVNPPADNYHLQADSPCIDAGSSEGAPDHDMDGDARPTGWYDIGADETDVVTGTTFIQQLIDEAQDGDVIEIPAGTYGVGNRNLNFKGKAITLRSAGGPGGVVIDVGGLGRGVVFTNAEGRDSILDGFTIINGHADKGGGVYIENASPTLLNCTIVQNQATTDGGGIYVINGAPRIINCTVADNTVPSSGKGGGLYSLAVSGTPPTEVISSIFWNNRAGSDLKQIDHHYQYALIILNTATEPVMIVSYSDIQGGFAGAGNIDADPGFVNPSADDYHLQADSPCIDAGSSEGAPGFDMDGDARPTGWYDIGADETDVATGTTFIQQLIDEAQDGDVIEIPAGTYGVGNRNLNFKGKAITLRSAGGPGGVVIDVGGLGRGVVFTNAEGSDSMLDGFTIINGHADKGGGVYIENASPTLLNCTIVQNQATTDGGGIYVINGAPRIINCTVADNAITSDGGSGGGLHSAAYDGLHNTEVISSIFWNNRKVSDFNQIGYNYKYNSISYESVTTPPRVTNCDVQGGYSGIANIDADPRFVDPSADDYHLQTDSPCIDVGIATTVAVLDMDGQPRPQKWPEIGADELFGVLPDYWKQQYFGTANVDINADPDGDGLTNMQEYLLFCADPTDADTDNDGVNDGSEANAETSICTSDVDGDGMTDDWEVANGLNPMYADGGDDPDGDGLTNFTEYNWGCLSPIMADSDGDTLSDGTEDANANGVRDGGETSPCNADTDSDGMPDNWELNNTLNPIVANAAEDPDGDGLPNIIEFQWGCLSPNNWDMDGDSIADGAEDSNQNGAHDSGETHPCNRDTDGNGIDDGCQAGTDAYAPEITLRGEQSVSICQNETYIDQGATAADNCDGDISSAISVDNPVNTSQPGVYIVTYTVADAHGNAAAPATRMVIVLGLEDTVQIETTYDYDSIGRLRRIVKQAQ